jgi:hypothetical protein
MFFLFGERIVSESIYSGEHTCPVCRSTRPFSKVVETNYFTCFGFRLLPIQKMADYLSCTSCNNSFAAENLDEPSQCESVQQVLIYVLLGYGMYDHREVAQEIYLKLTGFEFSDDALRRQVRRFENDKEDAFGLLQTAAAYVNAAGKQQIVEAAFLMTHASCEIQFEDRVRVNLVGNALGVSLQFVESVIDNARSQGYYGIRRLLSAAS